MNLVLKKANFVRNIFTKQLRNYSAYDLFNYRSLISVRGPDSPTYLQNLITNDIRLLNKNTLNNGENETQQQNKSSLFAMILNNRGRIMYDTIIYKNQNSTNDQINESEYFLEIDSRFVQDALRLFKMLKVKKKVEVGEADKNLKLLSIVNENNKLLDLNESSNFNESQVIVKDPRYSSLGYRAIIKTDHNLKSNNLISILSLFISEKNISYFLLLGLIPNVEIKRNINEYKEFLYKNGIAENNDDIKQGNSIPLEYNLVFLNGGKI
jgi:folate-binding Fe-S cluster repair protein YgfZ